jgi:MFS superfamily sulfate permease-like transporter
LRRELIAGLTGALLVIPQAITFAYLAGVAPEYGFYCAVFVGFLASLPGNSPMVGGPNTAVSILLGSDGAAVCRPWQPTIHAARARTESNGRLDSTHHLVAAWRSIIPLLQSSGDHWHQSKESAFC